MSEITVKAIKSFEGEEGFKNSESAPFAVTSQRLADLKAHHLVEEVGAKAAPAPQNKMDPAPANKAVEAPKKK